MTDAGYDYDARVEKFVTEIKLLRACRHDNIVNFIGAFLSRVRDQVCMRAHTRTCKVACTGNGSCMMCFALNNGMYTADQLLASRALKLLYNCNTMHSARLFIQP